MMRTYKTEAIVIKRRNIGEADRILTIFTKDQGKCIVSAKGIRRIPSRRSAHVELLNNSILTLYQARHSPILVEAVSLQTFDLLKQDLGKIGFAYHICELIDGLCPENQEHHQVYFLLKNTLHRLNRCSLSFRSASGGEKSQGDLSVATSAFGEATLSRDDMLMIIHEFEVELLTLLGYWHKPQAASLSMDTQAFIENILERRLKSKRVFNFAKNEKKYI